MSEMKDRSVLRARMAAGIAAVAMLLVATRPGRGGDAALPGAERPGVGAFLVARQNLPDPNFFETVVLLLAYGEREGAAGLVLNRRTGVTVDDAVDGQGPFAGREDALYLGGPVAIETIVVLQRADQPPEGSTHILDDIYLIGHSDGVDGFLRAAPPASAVRFYAGYAGWSPGQLEDEISQGVWHVMAGDPARVFSEAPGESWADLIRIVFGPRA
jgi:putative transcriptional regulator